MKVNDEAIRQAMRPRRRWNWRKCIPLLALIWLAAAVLAALAMAPVFLWLAKGAAM